VKDPVRQSLAVWLLISKRFIGMGLAGLLMDLVKGEVLVLRTKRNPQATNTQNHSEFWFTWTVSRLCLRAGFKSLIHGIQEENNERLERCSQGVCHSVFIWAQSLAWS